MRILAIMVLISVVCGCGISEKVISNRHYTIYRMEGNDLPEVAIEINAQQYISKHDGNKYSLIVIDNRPGSIPGGVEALELSVDGKKFYFSNPDKEVAGFGANDQLSGSWYRYKLSKQEFKMIAFAKKVKAKISINRATVVVNMSASNIEYLREFYQRHPSQ